MLIALTALTGLTTQDRKGVYVSVSILATLVGVLTLLFPEVVEQAFHRGQGLRPLIWAQAWQEAKSAPIFGLGLLSVISVDSSQNVFETAHNAYLQVFWQGGAIGLGLFLILLAIAFRNAWSWGDQRRDYTVFCLLVFTACTMMTGVDTLIARPRDQWMLFWLPLALLLSYQSMAPRSRPS
jgi:O-antigen ligase